MKVVSNAGPLISLSKLGQLSILTHLYREILIPHEVYIEVVVRGLQYGEPDAYQTKHLIDKGIIKVKKLRKISFAPQRQIDLGEIFTIQLAISEKADIVLIDDELARDEARKQKLKVKGTVGVLVAAFKSKYLSKKIFLEIINEIRSRPDIWISEELCKKALKLIKK